MAAKPKKGRGRTVSPRSRPKRKKRKPAVARAAYLTRIWDVLRTIDEYEGGITLPDLCEEHPEAHERTLRRYLKSLSEMGLAIERKDAPGEFARYMINQHTRKLWRVEFNPDEAVGIALAAEILARDGYLSYAQTLDRMRSRLNGSLPEELREFLIQRRKSLALRPPSRKDDPEILNVLHRGLTGQRLIELDYQKPGDQVRRWKVKPLALAAGIGRLYLIGQGEGRDFFTEFAVPRIKRAALLEQIFERPEGFTLDGFFGAGFGLIPGGEPEDIRIRFTDWAATYVQEHEWHPTQKIVVNKDGSADLSMRCAVNGQLVSWVLSFGGCARVEGPETLREGVSSELAAVYKNYHD